MYNTDPIWPDMFLHFRGVGSRDTIRFNIIALFEKKGVLIHEYWSLYRIESATLY